MALSKELRDRILVYQKNEITGHHIYKNLAQRLAHTSNGEVLEKIAADEARHYKEWRTYTEQEVAPDRFHIGMYTLISRVFGFTFAIKLMERGEEVAQEDYQQLVGQIPEVEAILKDEDAHEAMLIDLLDEERLRYAGSMVLGLNDALVELTGTLAGLTLALQDTRLIALSGSITGIAAALSMAASEYLSTKSEKTAKDPIKASIYTGAAYIMTVLVLILPYLIFENYYVCLGFTLTSAILIIAFFNYYISVAKDEPFKERFLEMAGLSLSVAVLSFFVGYAIRAFLGIDV